tara:strand:+ start:397 stop:786 length:390 start_codon:yes stop_codon:yes gene_type:complete
MKNQLFTEIPDLEFLNKFLNLYGINNLEDSVEFSKYELIDLNIVDKIEDLIPELVMYYLPCKYEMFLTNMNVNKCLTILRQIIKLYNYELKKREHVQNKKKSIYYHLNKINNTNIKINNNKSKCILNFN